MTLFIKIRQFNNLVQDGYIFVEGSKAGSLQTQYIKSGSHKLKQPFNIICANDDRLKFKLSKDIKSYQANQTIAIGQLNIPVLLNRNKNVLNLDDDFLLDVELYGADNKVMGVLNCDITYDKVSYYQGEFAAGKQEIKKRAPGKKVALYKGKCPTKNLFSILDPACQGQQAKFIESIYKDGHQEFV